LLLLKVLNDRCRSQPANLGAAEPRYCSTTQQWRDSAGIKSGIKSGIKKVGEVADNESWNGAPSFPE
jgi:hypothetical protein